jgi:hypothetical protein
MQIRPIVRTYANILFCSVRAEISSSNLGMSHSTLASLASVKQPKTDEENRHSFQSSNSPLSLTVPEPTLVQTTNSSERTITKTLAFYKHHWIVHLTPITTTFLSRLLPILAISVLANVHSIDLILDLLALFTALFAIGLVVFSPTSSKVEIFTATYCVSHFRSPVHIPTHLETSADYKITVSRLSWWFLCKIKSVHSRWEQGFYQSPGSW